MPGRFKIYMVIISMALIIAFLLGPPAAFASKLPTHCNIFHKNMKDKTGCCGHRAVSKIQDNSYETPAVLLSRVDFEIGYFLVAQNNFPSFFYSFPSNSQFSPLRC